MAPKQITLITCIIIISRQFKAADSGFTL